MQNVKVLKYRVTDSCLHIPAPGVCPPLGEGVSPFSKRHAWFFSFELGHAVYCKRAVCYFPGGISLVFIFIGWSWNTFNMSVLWFLKLNYFSVHWIFCTQQHNFFALPYFLNRKLNALKLCTCQLYFNMWLKDNIIKNDLKTNAEIQPFLFIPFF